MYSLLDSCDILATKASTVALEALMMDKPVITINITDQPDRLPYATSGATLGVYKYKDMEGAIQKILDNQIQKNMKDKDKFIKDYAYKNDGKATERVLNIVQGIVENEN